MKKSVQIAILVSILTTLSIGKCFCYHDPLGFMLKGDLPQALTYAKKDNKPVMVYLYAKNCISSRRFTREIIANPCFASWADKNFVCVEANITTIDGTQIAKKYKVSSLPAIIMFSYDLVLEYSVKIKDDSAFLYNQFHSFITAFNLKGQIEMLQKVNGYSFKKASRAIAKTYAKSDFKKDSNISAEEMAIDRTLNIKKLSCLSKAYIAEYKKLAKK